MHLKIKVQDNKKKKKKNDYTFAKENGFFLKEGI